MWNGRFEICDEGASYRGPVHESRRHGHVALQIIHDDGQPVTIEGTDGPLTGPAFVIGPRIPHRLSPRPSVTALYIEPQTRSGQALLRAYAAPIAVAPALSGLDLRGLLRHLESDAGSALEPRLAAALVLIESLGPADPVAAAARAVGLSAPRLRALAARELAVPLVRWLLWRKLITASRAMAAGAPLAEAAQSGGFADQAHLSRTMRAMFGITPGIARTPLIAPAAAHDRA